MTFSSKSTFVDRVIATYMDRLFNSGHGPWAVAAAINLAFNAPRIEKRLEVLEQLENPPKKITIPGSISYYNAKHPKENRVYELDQTEQKPGYFTKMHTGYLEAFSELCAATPCAAFDIDSLPHHRGSQSNRIHLSEIIRVS